jgi:hypothetical protein
MSLIAMVLAARALGADFGVCFADVPAADLEAAQLKPLTQQGSMPVVVEAGVNEPDLKDIPLPQSPSTQSSRFGNIRMDVLVYLKDVEILTGIPSSGFALPFAVQTPEAKR